MTVSKQDDGMEDIKSRVAKARAAYGQLKTSRKCDQDKQKYHDQILYDLGPLHPILWLRDIESVPGKMTSSLTYFLTTA